MDEFERELLIMDLEQEAEEYDVAYAAEVAKNPDWYNKAKGLMECSREEYYKAKEICSNFYRFHPHGVSCFFERVKLFEQAMINGKWLNF